MAPIHEAVRQWDVEALRRELERGVDPDLRVSETDYRTPLQLLPRSFETNVPYIQKVIDAGGIANYERAHFASRVATFTPKLAHLLPPELVRRVVAFWMHAGDY